METLSEVDPALKRDLGPPQPYLFRVLECRHPLAPSARHALGEIDSVVIGRGERGCDRGPRRKQLRIRVPDPWMSTAHAELIRQDGAWLIEDAGSRNGTLVNGAPVERAAVADGDVLELGRTFFLFRREATSLGDPADLESSVLSSAVAELASLSLPLAQQIRGLIQVADATVSVVVQGETGTGKERIAQAVHALSRRPGAFVAVNCGALPDTLIEAELFGCRRGAFTGAQDRPGLIRAADGGTLFLDEVGDLPLAAQVALLRVLQERQVHPVGATRPVPVDFRLVSATQEPLEDLVRAGRLRSDLLARLAGITVRLPPLRDRREDLGIITATLLRRLAPERAHGLAFDKEAARALLLHPFPLNIRELEKALERAIALTAGEPIRLEHLSLDVLPGAAVPRAGAARPASFAPEDIELRQQLVALLDEHGGNLSATARSMGKAPVQIRRWLRRYQIDPAQFRR
ncbi:sigma 54-interacting transcriptional regulator [Sorangium sp. So ce134]